MIDDVGIARGRSAVEQTEDRLWAFLPGRIWPRAPTLGLMSADGGWLRARSGLGLAVPAVAFLLGFYRGAWRPVEQVTYGYSLAWACILLMVALAGCGVAIWLWLGFVVGDLLIFDHPPLGGFSQSVSLGEQIRGLLIPHFVSYVLLAALIVGTPLVALLARGALSGLLTSVARSTRAWLAAAAAAGAAGIHAALWTQAYPLLIRPLWTWRGRSRSPDAAAIAPIQDHALIIGVAAAVAAAISAYLSIVALERIAGHRLQPVARSQPSKPPNPAWTVLGSLVRAIVTTLMLAGLIPSLRHGLAAFSILSIAFLMQNMLLPQMPPARWWTARVPVGIRLVVAALVAWLVAWQIGRTAYETRFGRASITAKDFGPLLYATVVAIACTALLLPRVRGVGAQPPPGDAQGSAGRSSGTVTDA